MKFSLWPFRVQAPWWVKVDTDQPKCIYYFGPFDTVQEARQHQASYIEDLQAEYAQNIAPKILRCRPDVLTQCQSPHELLTDVR